MAIDGSPVVDAGHKIEPGQTLTLSDLASASLDAALTVILHKPRGVVSAHPEPGQTPAVRLLTRESLVGHSPSIPDRDTRLAPVGRLDMESRGLLILSEDGVVAKAVIGPASTLEKEYRVAVAGEITERALGLLRHGLELDGRGLRPANVSVIGERRMRFVLREGRNRQIRRTFEALGYTVESLHRTDFGPFTLGDLKSGTYQAVSI